MSGAPLDRATAFAPASVGNVAIGFDILGFAIDTLGDRVVGTLNFGRATVEKDLTLIRLVQSVEDIHQRRLAGAVLSEQSVDFAFMQVKIYMIVSEDAGKAFGDALSLQGEGHGCSAPSSYDCKRL